MINKTTLLMPAHILAVVLLLSPLSSQAQTQAQPISPTPNVSARLQIGIVANQAEQKRQSMQSAKAPTGGRSWESWEWTSAQAIEFYAAVADYVVLTKRLMGLITDYHTRHGPLPVTRLGDCLANIVDLLKSSDASLRVHRLSSLYPPDKELAITAHMIVLETERGCTDSARLANWGTMDSIQRDRAEAAAAAEFQKRKQDTALRLRAITDALTGPQR